MCFFLTPILLPLSDGMFSVGCSPAPDPLPADRAVVLWLSLLQPSLPPESQRQQQLATHIFLTVYVFLLSCLYPFSPSIFHFHRLILLSFSLSSFHLTLCHTSQHSPTVCVGSCSHSHIQDSTCLSFCSFYKGEFQETLPRLEQLFQGDVVAIEKAVLPWGRCLVLVEGDRRLACRNGARSQEALAVAKASSKVVDMLKMYIYMYYCRSRVRIRWRHGSEFQQQRNWQRGQFL